ncbi:MAG: YIP1 family protein [Bacteroidota bacterium]
MVTIGPMIYCLVCAHPNDEHSTVCVQCGSFLQDRIPNLDFFSTLWQLVESPKEAFHRIIKAEHKNYVLFLMLFLGIGASFTLMWARHAGNEFDNLIYLLLLGYVLGVGIALPVGGLMAVTVHLLLRLLGGKGVMKNTYAIFGWSLIPIMFSVLIILPIEFASIGLRLFSTNPSPMDIKPVVYSVLMFFDLFAVLWSVNLARVGLSIAHEVSAWRSLEAVLTVCLFFTFALYKLFASFII